jgi:hypothetical protein
MKIIISLLFCFCIFCNKETIYLELNQNPDTSYYKVLKVEIGTLNGHKVKKIIVERK